MTSQKTSNLGGTVGVKPSDTDAMHSTTASTTPMKRWHWEYQQYGFNDTRCSPTVVCCIVSVPAFLMVVDCVVGHILVRNSTGTNNTHAPSGPVRTDRIPFPKDSVASTASSRLLVCSTFPPLPRGDFFWLSGFLAKPEAEKRSSPRALQSVHQPIIGRHTDRLTRPHASHTTPNGTEKVRG